MNKGKRWFNHDANTAAAVVSEWDKTTSNSKEIKPVAPTGPPREFLGPGANYKCRALVDNWHI